MKSEFWPSSSKSSYVYYCNLQSSRLGTVYQIELLWLTLQLALFLLCLVSHTLRRVSIPASGPIQYNLLVPLFVSNTSPSDISYGLISGNRMRSSMKMLCGPCRLFYSLRWAWIGFLGWLLVDLATTLYIWRLGPTLQATTLPATLIFVISSRIRKWFPH